MGTLIHNRMGTYLPNNPQQFAIRSIHRAFGQRLVLSFKEICHMLNIKVSTGYFYKSQKIFPIPLKKIGNLLVGDARDLADYLDYLNHQRSHKN
jgi:predicted DNA-binding transcriptional regulator AlpA